MLVSAPVGRRHGNSYRVATSSSGRQKTEMVNAVIVDLGNVYHPDEITGAGFGCASIGVPAIHPKPAWTLVNIKC
jgi:hypothetical protein